MPKQGRSEGRAADIKRDLDRIRIAYRRAVAIGMRRPVIFLLDCDDPIGEQFARSLKGHDHVEAGLKALRAGGAIPPNARGVLIDAFEGEEREVTASHFAALAERIKELIRQCRAIEPCPGLNKPYTAYLKFDWKGNVVTHGATFRG
jgi:hypothetical protein